MSDKFSDVDRTKMFKSIKSSLYKMFSSGGDVRKEMRDAITGRHQGKLEDVDWPKLKRSDVYREKEQMFMRNAVPKDVYEKILRTYSNATNVSSKMITEYIKYAPMQDVRKFTSDEIKRLTQVFSVEHTDRSLKAVTDLTEKYGKRRISDAGYLLRANQYYKHKDVINKAFRETPVYSNNNKFIGRSTLDDVFYEIGSSMTMVPSAVASLTKFTEYNKKMSSAANKYAKLIRSGRVSSPSVVDPSLFKMFTSRPTSPLTPNKSILPDLSKATEAGQSLIIKDALKNIKAPETGYLDKLFASVTTSPQDIIEPQKPVITPDKPIQPQPKSIMDWIRSKKNTLIDVGIGAAGSGLLAGVVGHITSLATSGFMPPFASGGDIFPQQKAYSSEYSKIREDAVKRLILKRNQIQAAGRLAGLRDNYQVSKQLKNIQLMRSPETAMGLIGRNTEDYLTSLFMQPRNYASGGMIDYLRNLHTIKNEGSVEKLLANNAIDASVLKHLAEKDLYEKFMFYAPRLGTSTLEWKMKQLGATPEQLSSFMGMQGKVVANQYARVPFFANGGQPSPNMIRISPHEALTKLWNPELEKLNNAGKDGNVSPDEVKGINLESIKSSIKGMFNGPLSSSKMDNISINSDSMGIKGVLNGAATNFIEQNTHSNIPTFASGGQNKSYSEASSTPSDTYDYAMKWTLDKRSINEHIERYLKSIKKNMFNEMDFTPINIGALMGMDPSDVRSQFLKRSANTPYYRNNPDKLQSVADQIVENLKIIRSSVDQKGVKVLSKSLQEISGLGNDYKQSVLSQFVPFKNTNFIPTRSLVSAPERDTRYDNVRYDKYQTTLLDTERNLFNRLPDILRPLQRPFNANYLPGLPEYTNPNAPVDMFGNNRVVVNTDTYNAVNSAMMQFTTIINNGIRALREFNSQVANGQKQLVNSTSLVATSIGNQGRNIPPTSIPNYPTMFPGEYRGEITYNRNFGTQPGTIDVSKRFQYPQSSLYTALDNGEIRQPSLLNRILGNTSDTSNKVTAFFNSKISGFFKDVANEMFNPKDMMYTVHGEVQQRIGGTFNVGNLPITSYTQSELDNILKTGKFSGKGGTQGQTVDSRQLGELRQLIANRKTFNDAEYEIIKALQEEFGHIIGGRNIKDLVKVQQRTQWMPPEPIFNPETGEPVINEFTGEPAMRRSEIGYTGIDVSMLKSSYEARGGNVDKFQQLVEHALGSIFTIPRELRDEFKKQWSQFLISNYGTSYSPASGVMGRKAANLVTYDQNLKPTLNTKLASDYGINVEKLDLETRGFASNYANEFTKSDGVITQFTRLNNEVNKTAMGMSGLARASDKLRAISWGAASLSMSAMGVYFSIQGVVMSIQSGIEKITSPLTDVDTLFKNMALSDAFAPTNRGAITASGYLKDIGLTSNDLLNTWKSLSYFTGTLSTMFASLGAKIFGDTSYMNDVLGSIREVFKELSKAENITTFKELFLSISKAIPSVIEGLKPLVNILKVLSDQPWLIKLAATMMMISLITQPIFSGISAIVSTFGGLMLVANAFVFMSRGIGMATVGAWGLSSALIGIVGTVGLLVAAWEGFGQLINTVFQTSVPTPSSMISGIFNNSGSHATGGEIVGSGGPTSDSNVARVSNGEYIINAKSAKKIGRSVLDALNKYATGGSVGTSSIPSNGTLQQSIASSTDFRRFGDQQASLIDKQTTYTKGNYDLLNQSYDRGAFHVIVDNGSGTGSSSNVNGGNLGGATYPGSTINPAYFSPYKGTSELGKALENIKFPEFTDKIENGVKTLGTKLGDVIKSLSDKFPDMFKDLRERLDELKEKARDKLDEIKEKVSEASEPVKNKVSEVVKDFGDKSSKLYQENTGKVTQTQEAIKKTSSWSPEGGYTYGEETPTTAKLSETMKTAGKGIGGKLADVLWTGKSTGGASIGKYANIDDPTAINNILRVGLQQGMGSNEQIAELGNQVVGGAVVGSGIVGASKAGTALYGLGASRTGALGTALRGVGGTLMRTPATAAAIGEAGVIATPVAGLGEVTYAMNQYRQGKITSEGLMQNAGQEPTAILTGGLGTYFTGKGLNQSEKTFGKEAVNNFLSNQANVLDNVVAPLATMMSGNPAGLAINNTLNDARKGFFGEMSKRGGILGSVGNTLSQDYKLSDIVGGGEMAFLGLGQTTNEQLSNAYKYLTTRGASGMGSDAANLLINSGGAIANGFMGLGTSAYNLLTGNNKNQEAKQETKNAGNTINVGGLTFNITTSKDISNSDEFKSMIEQNAPAIIQALGLSKSVY